MSASFFCKINNTFDLIASVILVFLLYSVNSWSSHGEFAGVSPSFRSRSVRRKNIRLGMSDNSSDPTSELGNEVEMIVPRKISFGDSMLALGTNPRRIVLSLLSGAGIGLVGNLFGVTSSLLEAIDEDIVTATGLDTFYPRGSYKRYTAGDYTLVIPKEWVADTALALAKAQRLARPLDLNMKTISIRTLPDSGMSFAICL